MSETVKLIIEIPKKVFEVRKMGEISPWVTVPILDAVQNGIPLDDVKAEIEKLSNANPSYWHSGDMVEREEVLEILDNIGKGDEE